MGSARDHFDYLIIWEPSEDHGEDPACADSSKVEGPFRACRPLQSWKKRSVLIKYQYGGRRTEAPNDGDKREGAG